MSILPLYEDPTVGVGHEAVVQIRIPMGISVKDSPTIDEI